MPGGARLNESERKSPAAPAAGRALPARSGFQPARSRTLLTRGRRREAWALHPGAPLLFLRAFRLDEGVFGQLD